MPRCSKRSPGPATHTRTHGGDAEHLYGGVRGGVPQGVRRQVAHGLVHAGLRGPQAGAHRRGRGGLGGAQGAVRGLGHRLRLAAEGDHRRRRRLQAHQVHHARLVRPAAPRPPPPRRPRRPERHQGRATSKPPLLPATTTTEGWHGGGTGPGPRALPVIIGPPTLPPSGADRRPGTLPHTGGCAGWARRRAPSRRGRSARTSRRWGPCSRATTSRSGCTSGRSWTGWRRRSTPSSRRPGGRTTTWATRGRARSGRGRGRTRTHPR